MEIVVIKVPTLSNKENIQNGSLASALVVKGYKKGLVLPKNATNGDLIKALFPNIDTAFTNVIDLNLWWNAKYKAESEDEQNASSKNVL